MPPRHKAILPASLLAELPTPPVASPAEGKPPPRKKRVTVACNNCRAKKSSCNGKRPTCTRCSTLNLACEYISIHQDKTSNEALKRQLELLQKDLRHHTDFLARLQSAPDSETLEMIRQLTATPNTAISSALSSVKGAMHTAARPSDLATARAILPRTDFNVEFELNMLHPSVYPVLSPLHLDGAINSEHPNGFQTTHPPSWPTRSLQIANQGLGSDAVDTPLQVSPPSPLRGTFSKRTSPIAGPLRDRRYCDARLNRLRIDFWTRIPISDEFAACVLSRHFETYHAIFGCVDCDLFLSDLVNHEANFCSPFLLCTIMFLACQSYNTYDVRSSAFTLTFMREAEVLWRAEQHSDDPMTLAALCYMTLACNVFGAEQSRYQSAIETRAMATRMQLIETQPTDHLLTEFCQLPAEKISQLAHVAWGVYGALSFLGTFFPDPPIMLPPMLPVPGGDSLRPPTDHLNWPAYSPAVYMG